MIAYIRKMKDWSVIKWAEPFEWSVPIWSNDNAKGTFKFAPDAPVSKEHIGEWLQFGENLWVIKDVKPSETEIVISVQDAFNAFYRSHIVPTGYTETGEFLEAVLNTNYKAQGDVEYAMPYLNVSNSDATPLIFPTLKNDILFVMSDYMREVSQRGVKISFTPTYSGIDIEITTHGTSPKAIPMDDGHSQLVKTEFSSNITSKVTVVVEGVNKYWYLQADGTAAQGIAPNPRIPGKWETIVVDDEAKSQDEVEKIFVKNTASSQIEFYSDKVFDFNEPVLILHGKKQYKAQISYVEINSNDNRYHYKAGDMPTTLIEKLRPVINEATETKSNGSGGGGSTANAVLYTPQLLTEAQKAQARTNIGAGTGSGGGDLTGAVRYDAVQSLADTAKSRARNNIGAGTSNFDGQYSSLTGRPTIPTKTSDLANDSGFGTYTKPVGGIPKTDLASGVQTSLNNADKAVRYDVQSLTDGQKGQARGNIGAYAKPLYGIPESDLSDAVKMKLNKTNIITIETEGADPLYPVLTSKTLDEIKDEFDLNLSEQFVVHENIAYKLEKIITEDNVEKAIFYSVPQIVDNKLHYFSCEIFDTPFNYSTAEFHTYIWAGSGGLIDSVNGQTGAVVLDAEDIEVGRDYPYGGPTNVDDAINDIYQKLGSETHDIFWVSFTRNSISLDDWRSDEPAAFILEQYALGYIIKAKVYLELGSPNYVIVDYRGKVRIDNKTQLVFSGIEGENVISILMYDPGEELPDEIEVSIEHYYQDLTPYRTAAEQDVIDATKQDVIEDLDTIRYGAERGATALQSVPSAYRTASLQDYLDEVALARKQDSLTFGANLTLAADGKTLSAVVPVKSVNSEIGSVYLDASNLKTTIPQPDASEPHEVEIYWDAQTDEGSMTIDGVTATRTNLNEAFSDGVKVNVNIDFDGATLLANPIVYGVENDVLYIQCYASGYAYGDGTPVLFWLDAGNSLKSQSGSTLNNPMPLPTGSVYTIEQYLEALEARIAALENA